MRGKSFVKLVVLIWVCSAIGRASDRASTDQGGAIIAEMERVVELYNASITELSTGGALALESKVGFALTQPERRLLQENSHLLPALVARRQIFFLANERPVVNFNVSEFLGNKLQLGSYQHMIMDPADMCQTDRDLGSSLEAALDRPRPRDRRHADQLRTSVAVLARIAHQQFSKGM